MKYAEYQIWFHVFNNVAGAMARSGFDGNEIISRSNAVANFALDRFSAVEDEVASKSQVDLQSIVDSVIKNAVKK